MDCEMPVMNGIDATKSIKEFLKKYNLPKYFNLWLIYK